MNISKEIAIQRYEMVREELRDRHPDQWAEVIRLCLSLPDRIDAAAVWHSGRNKPCYSNIKVAMGERIARDVAGCKAFGTWQAIASPEWNVRLRDRGRRWKRNDNFALAGQAVSNFVASLERGGLKSYLWRLYAIRELALALQEGRIGHCVAELCRSTEGGKPLPPERHQPWTREFARLTGCGWGHVTAYHLLTDLGVSVKPDLHLTRSVVRLGLLVPDYPSDLPNEEIDGSPVLQHQAVIAATELSRHIAPTAVPDKPRTALREVDKLLMEWSRQGLARPLAAPSAGRQ